MYLLPMLLSVMFNNVLSQGTVSTVQTDIATDRYSMSSSIPSEPYDENMTSLDDNDDLQALCASKYPCRNNSESEDVNNSGLSADGSGPIPLYVGAFFEGPGGGWDGSGCVPAIEMALDHINARQDILPDYELKAVWADTMCDSGAGSHGLFEQLFEDPTKIILLGGGCSSPAKALASTAHYWNLITVAYGSESPELSNRKFYPYFYRTSSPATVYNFARIRLIKEFHWTRVATIHENREHYKLIIDHLHNLLKEENITLITSESFSDNPSNQMENLKRKDAKIIFGNMYEDMARRVFCEAFKKGMTGKGFVWIMMGWYSHKFWEVDDDNIDCTIEQMRQAIHGFIGTETNLLNYDKDAVTVANITPAEYVHELKTRLAQPENQQYDYNLYGANGYDGAWNIALTLHTASEILKTRTFADNRTKKLEDFSYKDSEMRDMLFHIMADVNFEGVSGPVGFIKGDRVGMTQLEQHQVGCLGNWKRNGSHCYLFIPDSHVTWSEAKEQCLQNDAYLANVVTPEDREYLFDNWPPDQSMFWIGLHLADGKWKWSGSEVLTALPTWLTSSTNLTSTNVENGCVYMTNSGDMNVGSCETALPFICRGKTDLVSHTVGYFDVKRNYLRWETDPKLQLPDDEIPLDYTPQIVISRVRVHLGVPFHLFIIICSLACGGILMTLIFLVFNVSFRNQRFVKMSSPNLNNIILFGSLLIYMWVIVNGIDTTLVAKPIFTIVCQVRAWLLSIGFVLGFGAMFSKTWRVYRVATFKKPKRIVVQDKQLMMLVFVLLLVDILLLTAWQVTNPWYVATNQGFERDDPNVQHQKIIPYFDYCTCDRLLYWQMALLGYKGLLLLFGMFLAWETRKVTISALNDSKLIGISVYNVVILCTIGVAVNLIMSDNPSALYIFTASIVMFCASITLTVVFIPKMVSVFKYPEGPPMISSIRHPSRQDTYEKETPDTSPHFNSMNM